MQPLAKRKGEFRFTAVKSDEVLRDFITPLLFRVLVPPIRIVSRVEAK